MIFFISTLSIAFIVFLFCLYLFSRDDFILLRKNITLEEMFNYAFLAAGIGLLSGRIFHVLFHPSWQYLNPLVFLVFIYFPGLSLLGSVVGVSIFLFFLAQKKRLPRGRVLDIFSLSFLPAWSINLLFTVLITLIAQKHILLPQVILGILVLITFFIALATFQKNRAKDGTIVTVVLLIFSLGMLGQETVRLGITKQLFSNIEVITTVLLLFVSMILVFKQKILRKRRT